jgi:hypothetical protein
MAAPVWDKLRGIIGNILQIGGPSGPNVKNNSGVIELRNAADGAFATGRALHIASGAGLNDLVTLLDLQARVPNITFDFTGASAPSPGANTNQFGFCHTTGGGYTAGQVVYDDGVALILIPTEVVRTLTSSSAVTGTISLIQNGVYAWQGGTWILKGDGGSTDVGENQTIEVPFAFGDEGTTVSSTTQIPDGARILWSRVEVETVFDGAETVLLFLDGTANVNLLLTTEVDLQTVGSYQNREGFLVTAGNTGVVSVTLAGSTATVGAGRAWVTYVTPKV